MVKKCLKLWKLITGADYARPGFSLSAEDKQKYLSLAAKRNREEKQGDFFPSNANDSKPSFNLELGLPGDAY